MKINMTLRLELRNLELTDAADPLLERKTTWRPRWGYFPPTQGPNKDARSHELPVFVQAAKDELAALIAKHGVEALGAHIEIVREDVTSE